MATKTTKKKKYVPKKHTVFCLDCPETDIGALIITEIDGVGEFIAGDMENNKHLKEFNYQITTKKMTSKQIQNLPEFDD